MAENPKGKEQKSSLGYAEGEKLFAFVFLFAQRLYHWRLCFKRLHLDFSFACQSSLNQSLALFQNSHIFIFIFILTDFMVEERIRNSVLKGGSPTEENFDGKCFPIPLRLRMKMF